MVADGHPVGACADRQVLGSSLQGLVSYTVRIDLEPTDLALKPLQILPHGC